MAKNIINGKIYLVPSPIEDHYFADYLPIEITHVLNLVDYFIVEDLKTARRFIKKMNKQKNIDACLFHELNEHTDAKDLAVFIQPVLDGRSAALISDAGCPAIADPGQNFIALAHTQNIEVVPLVGPSSIVLALMASGLNGQQFKFNGYLPKEQKQRRQKLKELETDAAKTHTTHVFIETPYRNNHLLADMLNVLHTGTKICIASEIKSEQQLIRTKTVKDWKTTVPDLDKRNTVFLIGK
ncbi:MAG TPA: SAM-dependent methyltransferase [Flavobacteriales bacterium]|nr:SAM-dependent methyltransferase [Flavobacteriales bacterium]